MRRLAFALVTTAFLTSCAGEREKIPLVPVDNRPLPFQSSFSVADPDATIQLLRGFHKLEQRTWRWTEGRFVVAFRVPSGAAQRGAILTAECTLPGAMLQHTGGSVRLVVRVGEYPLPAVTWTEQGTRVYRTEVPASELARESVAVEFTLDRFAPARTLEERELGLIVRRFALTSR